MNRSILRIGPFSSNQKMAVILVLLIVFLGLLILLSEGFYGGGDSIAHYRISRYAFKYPHLFLDHWGKPLFTLFSAGFSQLGFNGMRLFNLLAAMGTVWFLCLMVRRLHVGEALLVPVFLFFSPLYFILLFSGLTEITFGLVLVAGIYFWFRKNPGWSALILSLIPFVRTEGIVLVSIFIGAFISFGRWRYTPLFLFGSVLFSLIGWKYYDDIFWVIHQMPYTGAREIYGSGSLLHYVKAMPEILGWPLLVLFITGLLVFGISRFQKEKGISRWLEIFLFILLPMVTYFVAHSIVWWKGIGSSLGMIRVMVGVIPLAVFFCVLGYDFLIRQWRANVIKKVVFPLVFIPAVIFIPFNDYPVPMKLDPQHQLLKEAAEWVKSSSYSDAKIYYYDLFFMHSLGRDPFDHEHGVEKVPNREQPGNGIPSGSLIQWDAHYGPNEGGLSLNRLMDNPELDMLVRFIPLQSFTVLGGHPYEIYIFRKK